jgi:3-oxoacyl-[acyl-carrier-protein] synthase II
MGVRRRVVVTGMGAICPTGNTADESWENAAAGRSGIGRITRFDSSTVANHIAGEVKGFLAQDHLGSKEARRTDRVTQLALVAAQEALTHSGLVIDEANMYRVGCVVGSGIGGIESLIDSVEVLHTKGHRAISPLAITRILIDTSSSYISLKHNLRGPNFNITTACATGNNAIGEATEIIRRGQADVMLAGATESAITPITMAGFNNMMALSRRNDEPERASRPFDRERDGFVAAEGAGILVLEELSHALDRGATIHGEILGYGHTSDAFHVTAPRENGEGAAEAIRLALADAGLPPSAIDYVNAHGTGTQLNDLAETNAIKTVFGAQAYEVSISSTKSVTGHMLGAGGAIEAIFAFHAIRDRRIPPTINLENPDPACDLDFVPLVGRELAVQHVMSNSFGFGGHNAVLVLGRYSA